MNNELGRITVDDLGAIAYSRISQKYRQWMWIGLISLFVWVFVSGILLFAFDDNKDPEYNVYEIRESITVVNKLPIIEPINDLKLYKNDDIEYMGTRYAPSYTENNYDRNNVIFIVIFFPFIVWALGFIYWSYLIEQKKKEFVNANCEVLDYYEKEK